MPASEHTSKNQTASVGQNASAKVKPAQSQLRPSAAHSFGSSQIRAANEDDDGYDPYSDRVERRPLFERDPWD